MASLVKYGKYGTINKRDTSTMGYYVIKFVSESYTWQDDTICYGQISSAGELVVKAQYLICMQENTNWHCWQKQQQKFIIVLTHYIVHTCLDVV